MADFVITTTETGNLTLAAMQSQLNEFAGLDLEDDEAKALLNEGYRELCARSEWLRANLDIGPTIADEEHYTLPLDCGRILKLFVNGNPYYPTDDEQVALIRSSNLRYSVPLGSNLYWLEGDEDGLDQVALYPAPTQADLSVSCFYVRRPTALEVDEDQALTPPDYDRAILDYATAIALASIEDEKATRDEYLLDFVRRAEDLRRLRNSRIGRYPMRLKIAGVDW